MFHQNFKRFNWLKIVKEEGGVEERCAVNDGGEIAVIITPTRSKLKSLFKLVICAVFACFKGLES